MTEPVTESVPKVRASIGEWSILHTGVFHVPHGEPCRIEVDSLKFVFKFEDEGDPGWLAKIVDDEYVITLTAHNNILTEGIFAPIEVATIRSQRLGITYATNTITTEKGVVRRLEYTLMLAKIK